MDEPQLLWTACAGVLREQVSEAVWLSSFANVTALSDDGAQLVLSVPSPWVKERIECRYLEMVRAALADVGAPRTDLLIEIRPDDRGRSGLSPMIRSTGSASDAKTRIPRVGRRGGRATAPTRTAQRSSIAPARDARATR